MFPAITSYAGDLLRNIFISISIRVARPTTGNSFHKSCCYRTLSKICFLFKVPCGYFRRSRYFFL